MCLQREVNHRQRIEELPKNVRELTQEVQELKQQLAKDRLF
jgi:predicted  nucleic acid-binding Zn-ribbon protein